MATHDYIISNASGAAVRADLNNALAAIATNNSSATEPTTTYAYQWWADTGSSPTVMKLRNAANSGWITLFQLDGEWTVVPFENGTAAAPSIYFKDSGTDTGLFSGGTDQVNITTGGTERVEWGTSEVVFNDGGNNYDFRVEGDTNANLLFVDASADAVGIGTTSPSAPLAFADSAGTAGDPNKIALFSVSGTPLYGFGISASQLDYVSGGSHVFYSRTGSTSTERARLDSSGRWLLGTSSSRPQFNGAYSGLLQVDTADNLQRIASLTYSGNDAGGAILLLNHQRSGAVGGNSVVASGDELGTIGFQGGDGSKLVYGASIAAYVDATPGANDMPGRLVFSTTADGASSPTERMRIGNAGYIKASEAANYLNGGAPYHEFNTNANDYTLQARSANASPAGVRIVYSAATPNNTGNNFLVCDDNTTSRAVIRSNGGLANFSANNVNLSDINAKKDISPAAGTWDCLKEWEIVNFRYKDQSDDADLNMGVIAQQVAESCPEVITVFQEAKDDQPEKLGIKEQQMYWMAIKALQEAQVRIEQLEAKVAALESA